MQVSTMKMVLLNKCLLVIIVATACSSAATTQKNAPAAGAVAPQAPKSDKTRRALDQRLVQIAAEARGRVGVAARLLETGEEASLSAGEHFPMQSVYKLPIAMAVLRRVDAGELKLDQMVQVAKSDFVRQGQASPVRDKYPNGTQLTLAELLRYTVGESDGTTSDVLLNLVGGGQAVMAFLKEINVSGLNIVNSEKEIGRDWQTQYENWATPRAALDLLAALHAQRGLSPESQKLVLKLMTESIPGQKRLKGQLPAGTVVAHKTGTGGTRNGVTSATNDIGIITLPNGRHIAVAVFISDSAADLATREAVIAKIAKALSDEWAKTP
jgi:beta-lactamase class A